MAILVTNSVQIARFANALYGIKLGSNTYAAVLEDVKALGLSSTVNAYYNYSFGNKTTSEVADIILANVGLTGDTAAHNLVVGKLNAAGAAKGAAILDMLNDFANLTSDATYGAAATAWNANVAAAQAYTAANSEDVATSATTSNTFTLTTGVDAFVGGAGNDTFNATGATWGSLDDVDGGAGANTLNVVSTDSVPAIKGSVANIQTLNVTSGGSVGTLASDLQLAAKQEVTFDFGATGISLGSAGTTGIVDVTVGGVTKTVGTSSSAATVALITDAIEAILDDAYGTTTATYATYSSNVITVKAAVAGVALPVISFAAGSGGDGVFTPTTAGEFEETVQENQAAVAATTASKFSAPTGVTALNVVADGDAYLGAKATTNTVVEAGGVVNLTTTLGADVTAGDSVSVTGAKGAVVISTAATATSITSLFSAAAGSTATSGKGIAVQGGTTVDIAIDSYAAQNTGKIQVGAVPSDYANTTSTTYPYVIGNLSKNPTGNVVIDSKTNYKSSTTGLTTSYYNKGVVEVYTNGATSVTVNGAAASSVIQDVQTQTTTPSYGATAVAGTSTLTTVNLAGLSGAGTTTVKSDAISNLSISDTLTAETVSVAGSSGTTSNTGVLNLTLSNAGKTGALVTIAAPNVSSVTIASGAAAQDKIATSSTITSNTGSASSVVLNTPKATSIAFSNTLPVTVDVSTEANYAKVASITATGSGAVTLGDVSDLHTATGKLTSIDASASSGALTLKIGATDAVHGLTVKGGSGNDSVTLEGSIGNTTTSSGTVVTTTVDLGAGNDKLLDGTSGALTAGAAIDGGAGTDTISGSLLSSGVAGLVKNFETVDIAGISGTYDMSLYTASAFDSVAISGAVSAATTVSKLAGTNVGLTVTSSAATTAISTVTATLATSSGTADTATVSFAPTKLTADATATMDGFKTTGIETISIASTQTQAAASSTYVGKGVITLLTDTTNATTGITVTGDGAFQLGSYTNSTTYTSGIAQNTTLATAGTATASVQAALTTIDASASTGVQTIVAGTSSNLNGSSVVQKYDGLTIKGGSGADFLVNTAKAGVVNGGAGADTITVTGAGAVVDGGSGADTIVVNAAVSTTLTGGSSADTFNVAAALVGTSGTSASYKFTTITDIAATDKIQFAAGSSSTTFTSTKVDVSSAASLAAALDLAAAGSGSSTAALIKWFQFGGDTYIVEDMTSGATLDATDTVVVLTGLVSLAASSTTTASSALLTIV